MTTEEALAEVGKVNERLSALDHQLHHAIRHPASGMIPLLEREISDAMARKEWLLEQIQRMQRATN
jgi:hypothetical protein